MANEYRKVIGEYFPILIPEVEERIYYQTVPENITEYPALAYLIDDEKQFFDLKGTVYAAEAVIRLGIVGDDVELLDAVKARVLSLCGVNTIPGVQLVELVDSGDSDTDLDVSPELTGIEINLKFHL